MLINIEFGTSPGDGFESPEVGFQGDSCAGPLYPLVRFLTFDNGADENEYSALGSVNAATLRENDIKRHIKELLDLSNDWDGEGSLAPDAHACQLAYRGLSWVVKTGIIPTDVVPSVEGGIGFAFFSEAGQGGIEFLNSGVILAAVDPVARYDQMPSVWRVADGGMEQALLRIGGELRLEPDSSVWIDID